MKSFVLQPSPSKTDKSWQYRLPFQAIALPRPNKPGVVFGKFVSFKTEAITFQVAQFASNRVIATDDPSKFVSVSFEGLRLPDSTMRENMEYIERFLDAGLFLDGVQYRFYHHSNSQLRGRSCWMRQANNDQELDDRIYSLGSFGSIMNVAKRAKRIGLLFSSAEIDYKLDPCHVQDIPDIKGGDEIFSDGCGLISRRLLQQISRAKGVVFRGNRYTPCVIQIRYLGYKGVLMLHPQMDKEKSCLVQFRSSMKKFTATVENTFSVVNYSKPYTFGRLNNDIIALISSLGITNEKLVTKQSEYFRWVQDASRDAPKALDFLSCLDKFDSVERLLLYGLEDSRVQADIRAGQLREMTTSRKDDSKFKSHMIIHKSRRLFGVCDPFQVLKEGQVHIRITMSRKGAATPINGDVLVVRNPCLHPGDCLKLRAVDHPQLSHLVDCVVFASVAKPGHHSAPSMSSGGDLDGDEYFVCWDPDLVPPRLSESYDYPPNKEHVNKSVTRHDLIKHFASYSGAGVAKVSRLHALWARSSPKGTLCAECQELNALHSQSVDGARIKIPDRLATPPTPPKDADPYVLDALEKAALKEIAEFSKSSVPNRVLKPGAIDVEDVKTLILEILRNEQIALSEYERFNMALRLARRHSLKPEELQPYLSHIDFSALTTAQKITLSSALGYSAKEELLPMWNSLFLSDILRARDLYQRQLDRPFPLQRLYSSKEQGLEVFFQYLQRATQEYTRKLLVIQTDERFSVGIFMRGEIPWDEDPEVNENVVVCSFMPTAPAQMSPYRPCTVGYRLHVSDGRLQLYDKTLAGTFIFITRAARAPGVDAGGIATSIALERISQRQLGRVLRSPVIAVELHVISNRDRVAHQLFDLWFEHVPTEAVIRRFEREVRHYERNSLKTVDWDTIAAPDSANSFLRSFFCPRNAELWKEEHLNTLSSTKLQTIINFCVDVHQEDDLFTAFRALIKIDPAPVDAILRSMDLYPSLVFALLHAYPPQDDCTLPPVLARWRVHILRNLIRCANQQGIPCLVAIEKMASDVGGLEIDQYLELLMLTACCVRSSQLTQDVSRPTDAAQEPSILPKEVRYAQEFLLVLNDSRAAFSDDNARNRYILKHSLAVAFDRAEEASETCPCDDKGRPRRQRLPPSQTTLSLIPDKPNHVKAALRVDASTAIRLHSHVRLQAASRTTNEFIDTPVMDGLVVGAFKGELTIELFHPCPPEMARMDWNLYDAGSTATSKAMMDALQRLSKEETSCCGYFLSIVDESTGGSSKTVEESASDTSSELDLGELRNSLNDSQIEAVRMCRKSKLCLIWGPPGTGKTTVVVQILRQLIQSSDEDTNIIMTASTHNAVDNVLERFIKANQGDARLLSDEQLLRVATDVGKVSKNLQEYTINARVGGDMNENNKLLKQAQQRVKAARVVFTTCAGAGLGILRKVDFDIALIDEASQITEPCALIPLVKGTKRGILVGDHVQLRPTVRRMAKALDYDVSLLERLYAQEETDVMGKSMLKMQYRFPEELAKFPSEEFYNGQLQTANLDSADILRVLEDCDFPWPRHPGTNSILPTIFIQCSEEEDMSGRTTSKSNKGQVDLIARIVPLLKIKPKPENPGSNDSTKVSAEDSKAIDQLKITILTPYTNQVKELKNVLPSTPCFTVDSFQGRESDIIVFSTVRCNLECEVGFVEDERRLNVMWTRARLALIIVGDKRTMTEKSALWKRAIGACQEVKLPEPVT